MAQGVPPCDSDTLMPWTARFTREETERYILSGCLKSENVFDTLRVTIPADAFIGPRHRLMWHTMLNVGWRNGDTGRLIDSIRYVVEEWEHRHTGQYVKPGWFATWFDEVIDASPAPYLTNQHAAYLLEIYGGLEQ